MKQVQWSPDLQLPERPRVAALGAFDGLHIGHARTIQAMRRTAHERDAQAAVLTFDPSPREFDDMRWRPGRRLTPVDEQMHCLERLGIDLAVVFEFPGDIHLMEPEDFVRDVLVEQLNVVHATASRTHRFGHEGRGDLETLLDLGEELGFEVATVSPVMVGGERVSSTRIRALLADGDVHGAGRLLGRPYAMYAPVVTGEGRGAELGFPTANLQVPPAKIMPADGVYAGLSGTVQGNDYASMEDPLPAAVNVGLAPTVRGDERIVEVHVIGRHCDLLGATLKVQFLRWLRAEERFEDAESLSEQIARDAERSTLVAGEPLPDGMRQFERICASDYVLRSGDPAGGDGRAPV